MKPDTTGLARALAAASLVLAAAGASAQTVKIGVVLPYSGVGAEFGQQVDRGIQTFMKMNPNAFGGIKVEFVKRDSKNPSGAEAKTAVQELITQEKVDILTGFIYSPDMGKTWAQYDLAEFGPRSPVRFHPKNSDGWFRVDLRRGWIERAEVLFIKPKP